MTRRCILPVFIATLLSSNAVFAQGQEEPSSPRLQGPLTILAFTPVRAKFVRVTRTPQGDAAPPWNIQTLRLIETKAASR